MGEAGLERATGDGLADLSRQGTRDAHDTDTTPTLGGGDGDDGFTGRVHGLSFNERIARRPTMGASFFRRFWRQALALVDASICRVMYHCCAMDRQLLTTQ
ncbi:hypothetical protein PtoMrB4_55910 [Metapseudomonas otitidis]|uniref:Uncharacterized protein n=1 Tax=Metapseudomonas otitidis TaxID=319939 RepID=A0A679H0K1_9GAMM|nr:hypothetical protein PtoMrB4_55910 [Pseudomonas otitidis]